MGDTDTQGESIVEASSAGVPVPGLLMVFSGQTPMYRLVPLVPGVNHIVGRNDLGGARVPDERVSSQHAELCWSPGRDGALTVRDLNSRHGVFVDGKRIDGTARVRLGSVLRMARTLLLVVDDLRCFYGGQIEVTPEGVLGPKLRQTLDRSALAARASAHLVANGETGTGKERVARAFHDAAGSRTPFVVVNCMAIPPHLANAAFFGAVRGAATDVRQSDGYLVTANGGVLFLDEIAELPLELQGMLLRAVESGEVTPVGGQTPSKINVRIVAASAIDLLTAVAEGTFRSDLYYRLTQAEVRVPALRERREEIPWLMQYAVNGKPVSLHVSIVEAVLLRPWPGNVRELLTETRKACTEALMEMPGEGARLREKHLRAEAGREVVPVQRPRKVAREETHDEPDDPDDGGLPPVPEGGTPPPEGAPAAPPPTREQVLDALRETDWNVSATGRLLRIPTNNRTQVYRLMRRYGIPLGQETP